jgi:tetratricopeptide (TPR) repeat protein
MATTAQAAPAAPSTTPADDAVLELKRQGNEHFVKNEFEQAIAMYDQALALDDKNGVLLANRSAAKLKLGKPDDALSDAVKALNIDPTWKKARHRKAQAEMELGLHWQARRTYEDGLKVEPNDKWTIQVI